MYDFLVDFWHSHLTSANVYAYNGMYIIPKEEIIVSSGITPLADRVVALREKAEAKTVSGLYLPDSAKEKPAYAVVESIGPEVKGLKKGDRIVFKEYTTTEIKLGDTEYLIVKEEDVLAKISSK